MDEAADIWGLAHTLRSLVEAGQSSDINSCKGNGDGQLLINWCADVRKLVEDDDHVSILDYVYGDTGQRAEGMITMTARPLLRNFMFALRQKPDTYAEYPKMYLHFWGG